jgi:hypothetical protein
MDAQSRVPVAAALAAVAQSLVRHHAQAPAVAVAAPELVDENRFLASRDGMQAQLIDARSQERRSVRDVLGERLARCGPLADELDCSAEVAAAATLADDPGDARQRRTVAGRPRRVAGAARGRVHSRDPGTRARVSGAGGPHDGPQDARPLLPSRILDTVELTGNQSLIRRGRHHHRRLGGVEGHAAARDAGAALAEEPSR